MRPQCASVFVYLLLIVPVAVHSETDLFQEGIRQQVKDERATYSTQSARGVIWQFEVSRDNTDFLMLGFENIAYKGDSPFVVDFYNSKFRKIESVSHDEFTAHDTFWSPVFGTKTVLVQVVAEEAPKGLTFALTSFFEHSDGAEFLSITLPDDRKHLAFYEDDIDLQQAARSVAKLVFVRGGYLYSCSGFMISDSEMMTNRHCIPDINVCRSTTAVFGYQLERTEGGGWRRRRGERYKCSSVEASDSHDISILTLQESPGSPDKWGSLSISTSNFQSGREMTLVHHPGGQAKQVTKDNCEATINQDDGNWVRHLCDTLNGSSGSPLLVDDHTVVAIHTLGYGFRDGKLEKQNRAIDLVRMRSTQ